MTNYYFGIKISKLVLAHQSIENSPTRLFEKKMSVEKGVANYYFGIKITSHFSSNTLIKRKLTCYDVGIKRGQ